MEGLSPQHHGFLNGLVDKTLKERRRTYAYFRESYKNNPLALEQIDIYDGESPHGRHINLYRDAFKNRDEDSQQREEAWFAENYPLSTQRYK